jgi:orotate phosphoribosyltransferase
MSIENIEQKNIGREVAKALLEIGAVKFVLENPITFSSGIKSPIYIDNREFPYHPEQWQTVIEGFKNIIKNDKISYDVIAGVAVGGIPHSAALSFLLKKPSIFVRKEIKEHGTKSLIEGGNIKNKKVLLVEDLVSTGKSSLSAVRTLCDEGAMVNDVLVIFNYEYTEAKKNFTNAGVNIHSLTSLPTILEEAKKLGILTEEQVVEIKKWSDNPHEWGKNISL